MERESPEFLELKLWLLPPAMRFAPSTKDCFFCCVGHLGCHSLSVDLVELALRAAVEVFF